MTLVEQPPVGGSRVIDRSGVGKLRCQAVTDDEHAAAGGVGQRCGERPGRVHYVGQGDAATDLISPVHGDLAGLPPLLIQAGSAEATLDDSRALRDTAAAAGVDVTLDIWPAMIHVWQLYAPKLPEARDAVNQAAAWLDRVWRAEGEEVR